MFVPKFTIKKNQKVHVGKKTYMDPMENSKHL